MTPYKIKTLEQVALHPVVVTTLIAPVPATVWEIVAS